MKSIRYLYVISFLNIFYSCDPGYFLEIRNNTSEDIEIKVGFDKEYLNNEWQGNSYMDYIRTYPKWKNMPPAIDFDTVNLVKTYVVKSEESFMMCRGISTYPDIELIKFLLILDSDSTYIENKEQLKKAFDVRDKLNWIMILD